MGKKDTKEVPGSGEAEAPENPTERMSAEEREAIEADRLARRRKPKDRKRLPTIEDASKGAPPWWPRPFRHLFMCFGWGPMRPIHCECPRSCRELCDAMTFHPGRSPRSDSPYLAVRPYTPIPNTMLRDWGKDFKVSPAVKLTFFYLVSHVRPPSRWVLWHPKKLASDLGITVRVLNQHARTLESLGLVLRRPVRDLANFESGGHSAFLMLDLPEGFPGWDDFKKADAVPEPEPDVPE